ncbi:MAG: sigma-70 family RNA polymerase sigma factor [Acidimicrobiia bacterium]|nr:sigma-70 family RNA polymerase sigma factor [Acidimicrobiia bacterium]
MYDVEFAEIFRTEWSQLVAVLVRDLGDLELAEDAAQEAFAEAARVWPTLDEMPHRPGAWLTTVARRKAIDRVRRSKSYESKLEQLEATARSGSVRSSSHALIDEQLTLLLGCCHPSLEPDAQMALTLRAVAGLSTRQIASAFLVPEATMSKRLTRAKAKLRAEGVSFGSLDKAALEERLGSLLGVIYLIFTEGHASSSEATLVRGDLCDEAGWLASVVAKLLPDNSEALGLCALILLTDARRATRVDADGLPVLLEDQDRTRWDIAEIRAGLDYLTAATRKGPLGPYGLQAAVASFHTTAPTFECTNWTRILELYDRMLEIHDSPVVRLNRAVAVSYVDGPDAALVAISALGGQLDGYVYFHSARAELLRRIGHVDGAALAYERALGCNPGAAERVFLERQLAEMSGKH